MADGTPEEVAKEKRSYTGVFLKAVLARAGAKKKRIETAEQDRSLSGPHPCIILSPMLRIETEREDDGRWLAEVPELPGVLSYGATDAEARARATALALRVIAERLDNGEALPRELSGMFQLA